MLISVLFFLSGFSALVYEITWARSLSLIFGTDSYGISTILAVFFTGLALGSYFLSKLLSIKNRFSEKPLLLYALLEFGIGIYALFSPLIFEAVKLIQSGIWRMFEPSFGSFNLITFLLSLIALIIPTTLMGATLPAIVAATDKNKAGLLYGINTLGAVLGVILSGFFLIGNFGVNQTIWLAASINIVIALIAYRLTLTTSIQKLTTSVQRPTSNVQQLILLSYTLSGFAAIGLEILWTRVFILTIGGSTYAFTIVLSVFLIGIALGSSLGTKLFSRTQKPIFWFSVLQTIMGILIILSLPLLNSLPLIYLTVFQKFSSSFTGLQIGLFFLSCLIIFIPTLIMGLSFPLILKAYSEEIQDLGKIYAGNTIGGIFGSLLTGFLFIPLFGTPKSVFIMSAVYLSIGFGILILTQKKAVIKISLVLVLIFISLTGIKFAKWDTVLLSSGLYVEPDIYLKLSKSQILKKIKKSPVLFEKEGVGSLITVKKDTDGNINMQINGKTDASTGSDMPNQVLLGQIPLLFHSNPRDILVVGLGSGVTLGSVLSHPVKTVDVVEIEKEVVEAAKFFKNYNNNALSDKRVKIIIADGRNYLSAAAKKYDVISSEPSNPWLSGSSKLFTKEYFNQLKNASKDDGIVIHWINMYSIGTIGLKSVFNAFLNVFPQVAAFGVPESNDFLLIGSKKPLNINEENLDRQLSNLSVKKDLEKAGISDSFEIISRYYLDRTKLLKVAKNVPVNTDNFPRLEFLAPLHLYFTENENPWRLFPENFISLNNQKAESLRQSLLFSRIYLIENNIGEAIISTEKALSFSPNNRYFQTILSRLYFEKASVFFNGKDYAKAAASYEKSLSLKKTPESYFNLGQSYEDTRPEKAKESYQKAISLDPAFTDALAKIANLYLDEGNLNMGLDTFIKLAGLEPENKETLLTLGNLYFLKQDFGHAKEYAQKVLKLDSQNREAQEILNKLP